MTGIIHKTLLMMYLIKNTTSLLCHDGAFGHRRHDLNPAAARAPYGLLPTVVISDQ
jgi:hypothetical protein